MYEKLIFQAGEDDQGRRLDRVVRKMFPALRLSAVYRLIRTGRVLLNGRTAAPDTRLRAGDRIGIDPSSLPPAEGEREAPASLSLPDFRRLILFENQHLLAVNKPSGWLVHGPGSLEDLVRAHLRDRSRSLSFRPGPVHRLDRNTSGLLLYGASLFGAATLSALLRSGRVDKYYLAVLDGRVRDRGLWIDPLARDRRRLRSYRAPGGRPAGTEVFPVLAREELSLVVCRILTGRTHQIRAQAALAGHPLAGDRKYGGSARLPAYLLHAARLRLQEEVAELGFRALEAPLFPRELDRVEELFGRGAGRRARQILDGLASIDKPDRKSEY
jgi:23S rRNA pseudouridine955/2504/2580 synthase